MTDQEFRTQYARMVDMYGERTEGHLREWWVAFKDLPVSEFREQVSTVILEYRPFGMDKWPTPGDFRFAVKVAEENEDPFKSSRYGEMEDIDGF